MIQDKVAARSSTDEEITNVKTADEIINRVLQLSVPEVDMD